jgi:hypothetical protein
MPADPWLWLGLAAVAAAIVGLALWLKFDVWLKTRHGDELRLTRSARPEPTTDRVSVASGATIEGSRTGDIVGVKSTDSDPVARAARTIDVLDRGTIRNSKTGDIAGRKTTGT